MSDSTKNKSFQTSMWDRTDTRKTKIGGDGEAFRSLYPGQGKKGGGNGFVASFVSEERAREIARNVSKAPQEEAKAEDLNEIRKRAYEEGFAEGRQAGYHEGRQQSREFIDRMECIVNHIDSAWADLIQIHESRIIDLVARSVEKVVYSQAILEQDMVKRAIIEALRVVPEPVNVQISVNPKDYEYIETIKEDFFSHIKGLKDVTVTPDSGVHQGGCNVRTKFGEVDATLESRLEAIRECLLKAGGKKAGPR